MLGVDPSHPTRAWRERIGIVLQESELDPLYTVRETVTQFGRYFSEPADVDATIARVGSDGQGATSGSVGCRAGRSGPSTWPSA